MKLQAERIPGKQEGNETGDGPENCLRTAEIIGKGAAAGLAAGKR